MQRTNAVLAVALLVCLGIAAPVRAEETIQIDEKAARAVDNLPTVESFLSPVGDPADFTRPAPGEDRGYRLTRGVQHRRDRHLGLDLSNRSAGGSVRAPADGIVVEARRYGAWGQLVVIAHQLTTGQRVLSLMAHLQPGSVLVRPGDRVAAGQTLGRVGSSGRATGPHLHFELRDLGKSDPWRALWERSPVLDPLRFLGRAVAAAFPAKGERDEERRWLQSMLGTSKVGRADAMLTRREFYAWVARASGSKIANGATWTRVRSRMSALGVTDLPAAAKAATAPIGHDEAVRSLALLLASGRLSPLQITPALGPSTLTDRGLTAPDANALVQLDATAVLAPDRPLSRADGALLLLAARERVETPERAR